MKSQFKRKTKETVVTVTLGELSAPGLSNVAVSTGLAFYDHMLTTLLKYAGVEAKVEASGDLSHHIMEDVAIVVGGAIRARMPPIRVCVRSTARPEIPDSGKYRAARRRRRRARRTRWR